MSFNFWIILATFHVKHFQRWMLIKVRIAPNLSTLLKQTISVDKNDGTKKIKATAQKKVSSCSLFNKVNTSERYFLFRKQKITWDEKLTRKCVKPMFVRRFSRCDVIPSNCALLGAFGSIKIVGVIRANRKSFGIRSPRCDSGGCDEGLETYVEELIQTTSSSLHKLFLF